MHSAICVSLIGLTVGLAACPAFAGGTKDRTGELDAAARAFLKAYQAKDLDALQKASDTPFFVGTLAKGRTLGTTDELRAELRSRLAAVGKFPSRVAKTLTWEKATAGGPDGERDGKTWKRLRPAIAVTGEDGGYAALADEAGGRNGRRLLAISDTRLLVGIRDGKAKVVGILVDELGAR
jgi:hypothetical protein